MFDWLRRIFGRSDEHKLGRFVQLVDDLNVEAGGGEPIVTEEFLGFLQLRSGTLVLGDPQWMPSPSIEVPNLSASEAAVSARLWCYPSGMQRIVSLKLEFADGPSGAFCRKIGEVGIDSAKLVAADKLDIEEHWTRAGEERVGVISTAPDDTVLRLLTRHFNLKTVRINPVRAELVDPPSEELAHAIENYLKSIPKYSEYPFLYFHVQTNNSFERANFMNKEWDFIPVGNESHPLMFVCGTGRGDGVYDVLCEFSGETPLVLSIKFIKEIEE